MKALKLGLTVLPFVLLTACSSQQIAPVDDEMVSLKASVQEALDAAHAAQNTANTARTESASALQTANTAKDAASAASSAASSAQATANSAQSAVDECCAKIDRMFEKTMQK